MKRICLILLLLVPLISSAQGHLLGKTKDEVRAAQKAANCPFVKTTITKLVYYDLFHCNDDLDVRCYYLHDTCWKVAEVRKLAQVDTMRQQLNASAQKVKKDQWVNKTARVKIQLTAYKRYDQFLWIIRRLIRRDINKNNILFARHCEVRSNPRLAERPSKFYTILFALYSLGLLRTLQ